MAASALVVEDFAGLLDLPTAYLRAVETGAGTLDVELRSGCYGLRPEEASGTIVLATGADVPDLELRLRATGGPCVLVGIPLAASARRIAVEGVAFVGLAGTALSLTATDAIELDGVTVLDVRSRPRERSALALTAAGGAGTALRLRGTVVARASASDAIVGAAPLTGAWFDTVELDDCTLAAGDAPALLSIDAAATVAIRDSRLRAPSGRSLVRMGWPPNDGEIRDCVLSAAAGDILVLRGDPPPGAPLRIEGATEMTAALAELPAHLRAGDAVREAAGEHVDGVVDGAIRAAAERLVEAEAGLAPRLLP